MPFDLSQVLFIATANTTSSIPPALLDRMEIIHVPGYTHEEKKHIARFHLIPKQLKEHGLSDEVMLITDDAVKSLITKYTREAGVRNLERRIGAVCRAVAVKVVEKQNNSDEIHDDAANRLHDLPSEKPEGNHEFEADSAQTVLEATLSPPPELPMILDDNALEDILGPPLFESELAARIGMSGVAVGLAWTQTGGEIMFVEATKMEGSILSLYQFN